MTGMRRTNDCEEVAVYRRVVAVTVLITYLLPSLLGCYTYRRLPEPTPTAMRAIKPPIRITRKGGWHVTLEHAQLIGDSLVGMESGVPHHSIALATADIQAVEVQQFDRTRTFWFVTGLSLGLIALGIYAYSTTPLFTFRSPDTTTTR